MLRQLYIRDYALIDEVTIAFEPGLNIITGETGAGKSIVLGAFGLLMGERASADVVRTGSAKAIVEAEFTIEGNPRLKKFLEKKEIEVDQDILIVRREVLQRGTGRGFINDTPATAQLLKELATFLVDLHGQHEHQSLLRAEDHIFLLDDYGGLSSQVIDYQAARNAFMLISSEIEKLKQRQTRLKEERDLFEFQLNEIRTLSPLPNEDDSIDSELTILENAEELQTSANELHAKLYDDDGSAYEQLSTARERLQHLSKIDTAFVGQLQELNAAVNSLSEIIKFLSDYENRIELDPARLQQLRERAIELSKLKRKYGPTLEQVLIRERDLAAKLDESENLAELISHKQIERKSAQVEASAAAEELSKARRSAGNKLSPLVVRALKELGIEKSEFEVRIERRELPITQIEGTAVVLADVPYAAGSRGMDDVEYYLSTNVGESPKPLAKVASGGEISRVMLALKTLLAKNDRLPLMVFDEIDVGVSGRIAQRVGRTMKLLAKEHQIIAISHLSQIAAFADVHYVVEKQVVKNTTFSKLRKLTNEEHIEEVARLISGEDVSEASVKAARSLIKESSVLTS